MKKEEKENTALLGDLDFNISEVEVLVETLNSSLFSEDDEKRTIFQDLIQGLLSDKTKELRENYNNVLMSNEDKWNNRFNQVRFIYRKREHFREHCQNGNKKMG